MYLISNKTFFLLIFTFTCFAPQVFSGKVWKSVSPKDIKPLLEINSSCKWEKMLCGENCTISDNRTELWNRTDLRNWTVYIDPCNNPQLRKFMHCNPSTLKCECYRNWANTGGIPNYEDKEVFEDTHEWLEYSKEEQECMVRSEARCSLINQVTPYRCINGGRCVKSFYGDEFHYYCSNESWSAILSFTFLQLWTSSLLSVSASLFLY